MKINKNILTSVIAVFCILSIMAGTILYAYQYTVTHAAVNNSFQSANGRGHQGGFQQNGTKGMPQGGSQQNGNNKFQGSPANGDIKK